MGTISVVNRVKKDMFRVIFYQSILILGFTLLLFLLKGAHSGLSAFAGAFAYWLATLIFIWRVSVQSIRPIGMGFLATFIGGEGFKLLLCGVLFVIFAKYLHVEMMYAVIGLVGAILAFWIASASLILKSGASS
jgi:F0F1-type ATP synthase assembly protein I